MIYKTEQEKFWAGEFGTQYIDRNNSESLLKSKIKMWYTIVERIGKFESAREYGCNIGLNMQALKFIKPNLDLFGLEINNEAALQASGKNIGQIKNCSITQPLSESKVDLTFTCCVLIHINPNYLASVYENLIKGSKKFVLIAEYYNPVPITIKYRGNTDKLFKRDFAGDLIENYNLKLVDYGFIYKRDNLAPQDDITWFLLEKRNCSF